ncbi:MAG: tRNA (adenosine(37)-N6)-threonylcarbamoyltransferase complex ATPase subunit type 1 TsaE [Acidimicrobiales bacterium]|nr:tRNA (adenosine(37)-N6)-threonylcarbamoyltransferase complex ATPase subunit type 1 TsaE [Hyphomonadaceae bacterium]RZV44589.1 MAG: tRNA (adenosine(37)-N6)-threonylcarbamoyltransferase complex ATPase subunit type 1 TsaE [Acidimicrobiales bacterium]
MVDLNKSFILDSEAQTRELGANLAPYLRREDVVVLRGDLGAGKTSFARGLIQALTEATEVPSPTYTLVQQYDAPEFGIWHFDLYRLDDPQDIWELGIEEAFDDGVCLIEWPERIESLLSGAELNIVITFADSGRVATLSGSKSWEKRLREL